MTSVGEEQVLLRIPLDDVGFHVEGIVAHRPYRTDEFTSFNLLNKLLELHRDS